MVAWKALMAPSSSVTWLPHSVPALALSAVRSSLTFWRAAWVPALPASGGSSWSSSATDAFSAAASQACADAAALKASVAELDQLDPADAGKAGIQAALQKVRDSLATLKASAGTEWGSQVTELDEAVNALQTTVAGIDGEGLLASLPAIVSDLERIDTAWTALDQQIEQSC